MTKAWYCVALALLSGCSHLSMSPPRESKPGEILGLDAFELPTFAEPGWTVQRGDKGANHGYELHNAKEHKSASIWQYEITRTDRFTEDSFLSEVKNRLERAGLCYGKPSVCSVEADKSIGEIGAKIEWMTADAKTGKRSGLSARGFICNRASMLQNVVIYSWDGKDAAEEEQAMREAHALFDSIKKKSAPTP